MIHVLLAVTPSKGHQAFISGGFETWIIGFLLGCITGVFIRGKAG